MLPKRIAIAVSLVVAGCGLSSAARASEPFPDNCRFEMAASLPMTYEGGHINVAVEANGKPFKFIIDTGGWASAISEKTATALGLRQYNFNGVKLIDAGGKSADHAVTLDTLKLGDEMARHIRMMVFTGHDGLIAPDLLRNFDLDFDFGANKLNLLKPHPCADHVVYWTDDFVEVPMALSDQGHIRFPIALDGQDLKAMLDTGAPHTMIDGDTSKGGKTPPETSLTFSLRGGNGGALEAAPQLFQSLRVGKFQWDDPVLLVSSKASGWHTDGADVLFGLNELRRLHLFIDYKHRKLYVSRAGGAPAATPASLVTPSAGAMTMIEPQEAVAKAQTGDTPVSGVFHLTVRATGRSNNVTYLDSETDFHDPRNLGVDLTVPAFLRLKAEYGQDPDAFLKDKEIAVTGAVRRVKIAVHHNGAPDTFYYQTHILVSDPGQIRVIPKG